MIRGAAVSEKSASAVPTACQALGGVVGEGKGLSCPKSVLGSVPIREPAKIPSGGEKAAVLFGSLWRVCVLDFNLFPEDTRMARKLESVCRHP